MYNVLHAGVLPVDTAKFFYFRELTLGGREISLVKGTPVRAVGHGHDGDGTA